MEERYLPLQEVEEHYLPLQEAQDRLGHLLSALYSPAFRRRLGSYWGQECLEE